MGINATYFDYYSNNELSQGWRNGLVGVQFDNNTYREQFTSFNDYIMNYAETHKAWRYPLVFGDLYTTGYMPVGSTDSSYWTNYLHDNGNGAEPYVFKRINNSNFMTSGADNSTINSNASIQGIVDSTLTNNNLTANDVAMPYFDYDLLQNAISTGDSIEIYVLNDNNTSGNKIWINAWGGSAEAEKEPFSLVASNVTLGKYTGDVYKVSIRSDRTNFQISTNGNDFQTNWQCNDINGTAINKTFVISQWSNGGFYL